MPTSNLVSHGHIRGVRFLNFLDQMSVAKVMRSSTLALLMLLAAAGARVGRSAKITVSIHWTPSDQLSFS